MSKVIAERGDVTLQVDRVPGDAFIRRLEATRFGSGRLRYYRQGTHALYSDQPHSWFFSIVSDGEVVGTYMLAQAHLEGDSRSVSCVYRGALTLRPDCRRRGIASWAMDTALDWFGNRSEYAFSFGLVESGNRSSATLLASKGSVIATSLRTHLLYRQWTRPSSRVVPLVGEPAASLAREYRWIQQPTSSQTLYGTVRGERVTATSSARLIHLDLSERGLSFAGVYSSLVKVLPPAQRRFDPCDFRYLSLTSVLVDPEHTDDFLELVSHLMHTSGAHMASVTLDPLGPTYRALDESGVFGAFARATRTDVDVHLLDGNTDAPDMEGPLQLYAPDM